MAKLSDGVVNGDLMREAASVISRMEAGDALAWLREREDTVGVFISRSSVWATTDLKEHHGIELNQIQENTVERAIIITAVAAVTAVMSGHYRAWRDLSMCTLLVEFDPLLSVRRRVTSTDAGPHSAKSSIKRRGGTSRSSDSNSKVVEATRFRFVNCKIATDADDPEASLLLLTTAVPSGAERREIVDRDDGEALLKSLVDCLSKLGSPLAAGAWKAVCGADANFDSPDTEDGDDEDSGDIEAGT